MNMINSIQYTNPITFTGKTYSKKHLKECEETFEYGRKKIKDIPLHRIQNFIVNDTHLRLDKDVFGYKAQKSTPLELYCGKRNKDFGFSTESGGYGGGWIKASINTPLSTKDVHTCALVNLINETTGEQLLYHVFHKTTKNEIKNLIQGELPRFTKANIMPGDQFQTTSTTKRIIEAIDELNPKVEKEFFHMSDFNPEVVAINGKLEYIPNKNPDKMTFIEITDQYN